MKYKWFVSDINVPSIVSPSLRDIQGFNVPCFSDFFYFKHSPYDLGNHPSYWSSYYFDISPNYTLGQTFFKFVKYDNVLFFADFGKSENGFIPERSWSYIPKNNPYFAYGLSHIGEYYLFVTFVNGASFAVTSFSNSDLDVFLLKTAEYFSKTDNILTIDIVRVVSSSSIDSQYCNVVYNSLFENSFGPLLYPSCCVLDYSPIVRLLGGIPA